MAIQVLRFQGELSEDEHVEADSAVVQALDECWPGLSRIAVSRFERGKQKSIGTVVLDSMNDFQPSPDSPEPPEPTEDKEEVLNTIYKILYWESRELERKIRARLSFYNAVGQDPKRILVTVIAPDLEAAEEEEEETFERAKLEEAAERNPEEATHAIVSLKTQKLYVEAIERTMDIQYRLIEEANRRYNDAARRESEIARLSMKKTQPEEILEGTLGKVLEQMVRMADAYYDVRKREAEIELEKYKELERAKNSGQVLKALSESVAPGLATVLAMKFGGVPPEAAMGVAGGLPGDEVKSDAPPPPPPPPPPPGEPRVTQVDNQNDKIKRALLDGVRELYESIDEEQRAQIEAMDGGVEFLKAWKKVKTGDQAIQFVAKRLSSEGDRYLTELTAVQSMAMGKILATVSLL